MSNLSRLAPPGRERVAERRLVFDSRSGAFYPCERVERYVRIIPFDWLHQSNRLPGNVTAVAVSLWFAAGVKKCATFRLTAEAVDLAGCSRKSLYRAIAALETAGLIRVCRRGGARPIITLEKQKLLPAVTNLAEMGTIDRPAGLRSERQSRSGWKK